MARAGASGPRSGQRLFSIGVGSLLRVARKRSEEHPVSGTEETRMGNSPHLTPRLLTAGAGVAA
jgi:hypothetical protein